MINVGRDTHKKIRVNLSCKSRFNQNWTVYSECKNDQIWHQWRGRQHEFLEIIFNLVYQINEANLEIEIASCLSTILTSLFEVHS